MSKIEKELLAATELKAKRGEDRQDLLGRIMKEVAELDDAAWDDLSQEAQDWFNDAADAKNAKAKTIPDFPDAEGDDEPEQEEEPEDNEELIPLWYLDSIADCISEEEMQEMREGYNDR